MLELGNATRHPSHRAVFTAAAFGMATVVMSLIADALRHTFGMSRTPDVITFGDLVYVSATTGREWAWWTAMILIIIATCVRVVADLARIALEIDNDVDRVNLRGNTPLHESCRDDDLRLTRFLLDRKASVNLVNRARQTPLDMAIAHGQQAELVRALLDARASLQDKREGAELAARAKLSMLDVLERVYKFEEKGGRSGPLEPPPVTNTLK